MSAHLERSGEIFDGLEIHFGFSSVVLEAFGDGNLQQLDAHEGCYFSDFLAADAFVVVVVAVVNGGDGSFRVFLHGVQWEILIRPNRWPAVNISISEYLCCIHRHQLQSDRNTMQIL